MAEDTRERSTTSAGLWPEAAASDLNDDSCWLYLMKGLGSDRDKRLALGVLRAFLQTITGEFKVEGQNGSTTITNLLTTILDSNDNKVEIGPNSITISKDGGTTTLTLTKSGVTVSGSGGSVEVTNSSVTVTSGSDVVVVNKDGVNVTDGSYTADLGKNHMTVSYGDYETSLNGSGVTVSKEGGSTTVLSEQGVTRVRREYSSDSPVSYSVSSWPKSASDAKASISDSTVVRINDTASGTTKRFKLDWTPAVDTEVVVDFQTTGDAALMILNKDDNISTADGFVLQAPNTVRRYVYKGSTTGWVCLY